jgi:four helix bundle protein
MVKGDDIEERLIDFAVQIINISTHLPITVARNHIGNQILRSGTAPAVHYAEARSS